MDPLTDPSLAGLLKIGGRPYSNTDAGTLEAFRPKTVFVVGNGAIENGELPLAKPIQQFADDFSKGSKNRNKAASLKSLPYAHILSIIATFDRRFREIFFDSLRDRLQNPDHLELEGDVVMEQLDGTTEFREKLAKAYESWPSGQMARSDQQLRLRPVPDTIQRLIETQESDIAVITTNWDNILWQTNWVKNCAYIHGRCEHPKSLMLPIEVSTQGDVPEDIYHSLQRAGLKTFSGVELFHRIYDEHAAARMTLHRHAIDWLQGAETVVFWGIALNVYDAEINSLLALADLHGPKKHVICVNKDGEAMANAARLVGSLEYQAVIP